jgi:molybdopterin molybdotransferase
MTDPLSVLKAQEQILEEFKPSGSTFSVLPKALGRILSSDIQASIDLPPFTNSGMDGFAVIAADTTGASVENPAILKIIGDIPAGTNPQFILHSGEAARIMTGAMLPEGSDAVVPLEDTDLSSINDFSSISELVKIYHPFGPGSYLRPKGQDLQKDQAALKKGKFLRPQDIGLLASLGMYQVPVYQKPRIALLTTGNELIDPSAKLSPGKIFDSNSYILSSLIEKYGGEVILLGAADDDPVSIRTLLQSAASSHADLILTSAGVSVGALDYVRLVIQEHGEIKFWRVNMRPGKPLAFGNYQNIPLIGLPGNPVSAFVGFMVFVVPALRKMTGLPQSHLQLRTAILTHPVESDGRESYLRAIISRRDDVLEATLTGHQGSGNLFSLVQANALLILPSGVKSLPTGNEVKFIPIDDDLGAD